MLEPERSPLDGGSRDPCHLEGGGLRATLRQWQGPARALPGGGGGGPSRRTAPGGGGGGAFRRASAVGGCAGVAVCSDWPDAPFRGRHGPPTIFYRRRHPHPVATEFCPPTTPVSTANATPPPSHRPCAPLASLCSSLPLAPPPHPDAICTRLSLSARACISIFTPHLSSLAWLPSSSRSLWTRALLAPLAPPRPPLLHFHDALRASIAFPIRVLGPKGTGRRRR